MKLALRGGSVNVDTTGPAIACGAPIWVQTGKGLRYEARVDGYHLVFSDTENRKPGIQNVDQTYSQVTLAGPEGLYGFPEGKRPTVEVSDDFKTARIEGEMENRRGNETYRLLATFECQ